MGKYLDSNGLAHYDSELKEWANSANQAGYKKVIQDGDSYKLYKDSTAVSTDTPDATISIADKSVYVTIIAGTGTDSYSRRYSIYQGQGSSVSPVASEKLVDIDIPKDMVVESGSVVDITFNNGHLYDGVTDVTALIKGAGGTAAAADAGKYIKLTIANAASDIIYIFAADLITEPSVDVANEALLFQ